MSIISHLIVFAFNALFRGDEDTVHRFYQLFRIGTERRVGEECVQILIPATGLFVLEIRKENRIKILTNPMRRFFGIVYIVGLIKEKIR